MQLQESSLNLTENYLFFKVFAKCNKNRIEIFFFLLLDIEQNLLIDFDGIVYKDEKNNDLVSVQDLSYQDLPFTFQSIQGNCEVLDEMVSTMKNEAKEHYFQTEDFIEIVTHYLFFTQEGKDNYLSEYLKDVINFIIGRNHFVEINFVWDFVSKAEQLENEFVSETDSSEGANNLEANGETLGNTEIKLEVNIEPISGKPLMNAKKGDKIAVKPIISDLTTLWTMNELQPGYKEGDIINSLWAEIGKIEILGDKINLELKIDKYVSRVEDLEKYIKVNFKLNSQSDIKDREKEIETNIKNKELSFYASVFSLVLLSIIIVFIFL